MPKIKLDELHDSHREEFRTMQCKKVSKQRQIYIRKLRNKASEKVVYWTNS